MTIQNSKSNGLNKNRIRLRPSPGELQHLIQQERTRRRHQRLKQVREQSAKAAKQIRDRVKAEREKQIQKFALEQLEKYKQEKLVELALLEEEYQQCLNDMGVGVKAAREAEQLDEHLEEQKKLKSLRADARGAAAIRKEQRKKQLDNKIKENRAHVRKSALQAEKLRTANIRKEAAEKKKIQLVEVSENDTKKTTLVSRKKFLNTLNDDGSKVTVKRLPLADVGVNGLEAAIREQERARRSEDLKILRAEEARRRYMEEVIQRAKEAHEHPLSHSDENLLSTIMEEDENTISYVSSLKRDRPTQTSGIDLVPERGPSRNNRITDPVVPQPRGSSMDNVSVGLTSEDIEAIKLLLKRSESRQSQMVDKPIQTTQVVEGEGEGAKNNDADRRFVAKVLGVSPNQLEIGKDDQIKVKVNVDELSHSTSESDSLANERFLNLPSENKQPSSSSQNGYKMIHQLIEDLKSSSSSPLESPVSFMEKRSSTLRYYIEKLLGMKREEIAELSVTTSSFSSEMPSSTTDPTPSPGISSSTTPTSILSSSDSHKSGSSKTVRFKDELDESYIKPKAKVSDEKSEKNLSIHDRRAEIEKKTQESLEEIRRTFSERKLEIEKALERRLALRVQKVRDKINLTPSISSSSVGEGDTISDGFLTDTGSDFLKSLSLSDSSGFTEYSTKASAISMSSDSDESKSVSSEQIIFDLDKKNFTNLTCLSTDTDDQ